MDHVLIPVCENDHWLLLVLDVKRRQIEVLDSIHNQSRRDKYERHLRTFLAVREKYVPDLDATGWTMSTRRSSQQTGGNDCGVFVLMVRITQIL